MSSRSHYTVKAGQTDVTIFVNLFYPGDPSIPDGPAPVNGVGYTDSGLTLGYMRPGSAPVHPSLANQTTTGSHIDGGWCAASASYLPGVYRLDLPDAVCAVGVPRVAVVVQYPVGTAVITDVITIDLIGYDPTQIYVPANVTHVNGTSQISADLGAQQSSMISSLATIAGYIDTEVGAIKTKIDALPTFPSNFASLSIHTDGKMQLKDASIAAATFASGAINNAAFDVTENNFVWPSAWNTAINALLADLQILMDEDSVAALAVAVAESPTLQAFLTKVTITGTVDDTGTTTLLFKGNSALASTDDFYNGSSVVFTSGTLKGIARKVTDYTGSTRQFTVSPALPAAPANGVEFYLLGRIE